MTSVLIGTSALSALLLAALVLTWLRGVPDQPDPRLLPVLQLAIVVHCLHASEEFVTGFHRQFPAFFGLTPWSAEFFVVFNMTWLAIWTLASLALYSTAQAWRVQRVPRPVWASVWFLALASCGNAVAHPLLAVASGGYFPGLWTSPLAGVAGFALARRLLLSP